MVQTITELLQNKGRKTLPVLSPALQQKRNEIITAYGTRESFLSTFNPDLQRDLCVHQELCFFGETPTLGQLNVTYGERTAAMWLVPQLYNLSEYCGCKDKLEGNPLKECSIVISSEFSYLKVSEMMLFFHRFKAGKYGHFYGSVDPLVITTALREFLRERAIAYDNKEHEEQRAKDEESRKNAVTWDEYCMKEYGELRPHPLNRLKDGSK